MTNNLVIVTSDAGAIAILTPRSVTETDTRRRKAATKVLMVASIDAYVDTRVVRSYVIVSLAQATSMTEGQSDLLKSMILSGPILRRVYFGTYM